MTDRMGPPFAMSVRSNASKSPVLLLLAMCCAAPLGCNNGKQLHADLYQRELRLQEDEIYRLEDYIEEYQAIIRGYRMEVADLKKQLAEGTSATTGALPEPTPVDQAKPIPLEEDEAPRFERPFPAPDADEAPPFKPSSAIQPLILSPEEQESNTLTQLRNTPPARFVEPFGSKRIPVSREVESGDDQKLSLSLKNGPKEATGEPTLLAMVRSTEGVDFQGEVSLLLTDPAEPGAGGAKEKKLARWDFSSQEVSSAMNHEGVIELALMLPLEPEDQPPTDKPLRMWVRVVGEEGKKRLGHEEVEFFTRPFRLYEPRQLTQAGDPTGEQQTQWRTAVVGDRYSTPASDGVIQASAVAPITQ